MMCIHLHAWHRVDTRSVVRGGLVASSFFEIGHL
jgi:hypothetical protein